MPMFISRCPFRPDRICARCPASTIFAGDVASLVKGLRPRGPFHGGLRCFPCGSLGGPEVESHGGDCYVSGRGVDCCREHLVDGEEPQAVNFEKTVYDTIKAKFSATAVLVLIVAMVIACAPAGQPAQDTNGEATPEPTATPEIKYLVDSSGHRFAVEVVPEREGPIILHSSLERNALEYQATKDANQRSGKSIDPEPRPEVIIYVDSAARVQEIEQYLKRASITVISKTTEPSVSWPGALIANIPITKLLDLADQPGVLRIERILNQSQGGMCICRVLGIGAGVSRECFGP